MVDFEDQHQGMGCADAVSITSSGLRDLSSDFSPNWCGCPMGLRLFRTNPGGKLAPDFSSPCGCSKVGNMTLEKTKEMAAIKVSQSS